MSDKEDVIEKNIEVVITVFEKTVFENMDIFRCMENNLLIYDDLARIISIAIDQSFICKETTGLLMEEVSLSSVELRSKLINLINNNASDNLDL